MVDTHAERMSRVRDMVVGASAAHAYLLKNAGFGPGHIHLLLGIGITDSPAAVALSFMNNIASVYGMKAVLQQGYFVATVGEYDLGAIR